MATIADLEKEIELLKQRNLRVDANKAWEIGWSRKIVIGAITYLTISLAMLYLGFDKPFFGAIIPTLGFILSTLSISFIKNFWLKHIYKN